MTTTAACNSNSIPAGERDRQRERNPHESHSKQHQSRQGVTRWRKPFQEAKPRHSRHQIASDKKPCPPNGVRKKGGLLGSASTCTCYCQRPSVKMQLQKGHFAGCELKHMTTGQCVWRVSRWAMPPCCESTTNKALFPFPLIFVAVVLQLFLHCRTSHRRRLQTQHLECGPTGLR